MPTHTTRSSDAELLSAYEGGDLAAFEALYDRHRRGVYGFLVGLCGDGSLAADAAQDTWLAVVEQTGRFAAAQNPRAYLYRAARNRVIELQRARGRDRRATQSVPLVRAARPQVDAEALNQALRALPDDQREVVLLRIYEDMTFPEIAEVTGHNLKTVESRHRLALDKLRHALPGEAP
ncbi:MAG: sigma-70 family RNA polymerase sigma factor [Planctomycetes bacterium]|nr:sigma-70 family RNA polymerase sigma factor [Planctomycetota bacterium]